MHLDGTSLPVLGDEAPGNIKLGSLWGYVGVDGNAATALYIYNATGKAKGQEPNEIGPDEMLSWSQGYTVADASGLFDAGFKRTGIIERVSVRPIAVGSRLTALCDLVSAAVAPGSRLQA